MRYLVFAVALLLLASVAIFVKAALFDKRPQKTGLILSLLAIPLYLVYYNDRFPPWHQFVNGASLRMRDVVQPLGRIAARQPELPVRHRPGRPGRGGAADPHDGASSGSPSAGGCSGCTTRSPTSSRLAIIAILIGGMIVSTFALGWIGAIWSSRRLRPGLPGRAGAARRDHRGRRRAVAAVPGLAQAQGLHGRHLDHPGLQLDLLAVRSPRLAGLDRADPGGHGQPGVAVPAGAGRPGPGAVRGVPARPQPQAPHPA